MLVVRTVWGEDVDSPADDNLRTRLFRVYDAAGELTNEAYDFKGNLLQQQRRLAIEYETTQDWSLLDDASPPTADNIAALADPLLEDEVFPFAIEYDALDRVTSPARHPTTRKRCSATTRPVSSRPSTLTSAAPNRRRASSRTSTTAPAANASAASTATAR